MIVNLLNFVCWLIYDDIVTYTITPKLNVGSFDSQMI